MPKKLADFRPQAVNANRHTPRGLGMLRDGIGKDGWIGAEALILTAVQISDGAVIGAARW